MKKRSKVVFAAVILVVALSVSAFAATAGRNILIYPGISIYIDDAKLNPTDVNGNPVEVFSYNGTTYLPVRAISEAFGKQVQWDGKTQSVYIGSHSTAQQPQQQPASVTTEQKNALKKAQSYLSFTSFSRKGLIEQLEFEGFSTEASTYAVDNCGANWYEQAAKKAQSYLNFSSFSRQGLIEQLEFEGFTHDQAVYGVDQVY